MGIVEVEISPKFLTSLVLIDFYWYNILYNFLYNCWDMRWSDDD
jgi:hypothetical protein